MLKPVLLAFALLAQYATAFSDTSAITQLLESSKNQTVTAPVPAAQAYNDRYWVVIKASSPRARTALLNKGMDIIEVSGGLSSGIVSGKALLRIKQAGFKVQYETTLDKFNREFIKDFPPKDAKYHNYSETYAALKQAEATAAGLAQVLSIGKSSEGRDIWAIRFCGNKAGKQKPGAVFMGAHHAREHLSVEVPLLFAVWLADNKDKPEVKKVLDERDIYVIPMVNPDGTEYDIQGGSYQWWRKNTRKLPKNAIGVDLNRNYGYLWGGEGASSDPDDETYRGPSAFSEPETQAVKNFFDSRKNIKVFISYHSYSQLILYPWGGTSSPISDSRDLQTYKALAQKMAGFTGYTAQQSSDMYVATGDTTDWTYAQYKIFSFTIELSPGQYNYGGFYPGPSIIAKTVDSNIKAAFYLAEMADNPYRAVSQQ